MAEREMGQLREFVLSDAFLVGSGFGDALVSPDPVQQVSEPSDVIPGNNGSTFTLAIGGSETGVVNVVSDDDWFRVDLVAGQSYVFTLTGSSLAPLEDPYLELYSAGGTLLAIDDDAGPIRDSMLRFTAQTTGTYYINARAWEPDGAVPPGYTGTGGYTITAALGPPQNPLDTIDLGIVAPLTIDVYFATLGQSFNGVTASRNWTQAEIDAAFAAMATYSAVTPIVFTRTMVAGNAEWVLSISTGLGAGVLGQFGTTGGIGYGAFAQNGAGWSSAGLTAGGLGFATMLHEFGHGLGLAHPHDNGGDSEIMEGVIDAFNSYGTHFLNQGVFTTMSYNEGWPQGPWYTASVTSGAQMTPGPLDIGLLQSRYGTHANNVGDTNYVLGSLNGFQTIWDTGGTDTISYNGSNLVIIDLRAATLLNDDFGGGGISVVGLTNAGYAIAAGAVIENALGGSNNDTLYGNAANNRLDGGPGGDLMTGGAGDDYYIVDSDMDNIVELPGGGVDTIETNIFTAQLFPDVEVLIVGSATVNLLGNNLANVLTGNANNNLLDGQNGDDTLIGGSGADQHLGGAGIDTASYANAAAGVVVRMLSLGANTGDAVGDTYTSIENLRGSAFNDLLAADNNAKSVFGGAGNDMLAGEGGDDTVLGETGDDMVWGNTGADAVGGGAGIDSVWGGGGNDRLWGDAGDDALDGQADDDNIWGGDGNDNIWGGDGNDALDGLAGQDSIEGNAGADSMWGSDGNDRLWGGAGDDVIDSGNGEDKLDGEAGNDRLFGLHGADVLWGGVGDDVLDGGIFDDLLIGGEGLDQLWGGSGNDVFWMQPGWGVDIIYDFDHAGGDLLVFEWPGLVPGQLGYNYDALNNFTQFWFAGNIVWVHGFADMSDVVVYGG